MFCFIVYVLFYKVLHLKDTNEPGSVAGYCSVCIVIIWGLFGIIWATYHVKKAVFQYIPLWLCWHKLKSILLWWQFNGIFCLLWTEPGIKSRWGHIVIVLFTICLYHIRGCFCPLPLLRFLHTCRVQQKWWDFKVRAYVPEKMAQ